MLFIPRSTRLYYSIRFNSTLLIFPVYELVGLSSLHLLRLPAALFTQFESEDRHLISTAFHAWRFWVQLRSIAPPGPIDIKAPRPDFINILGANRHQSFPSGLVPHRNNKLPKHARVASSTIRSEETVLE